MDFARAIKELKFWGGASTLILMVSLFGVGFSGLNTNFKRATEKVSRALERLSTGKRLNSVSDGAVDLARFQNLQAQSRGLGQVLRNVDDVASMAERADSTLSAMMQMAFDLREIAQRAAKSDLTPTERSDLQDEAKRIISDFNSYATDTSYNTIKLLDGSFGTKSVQNGLSATSSFSFNLGDARTTTLGQLAIVSSTQNFLDPSAYVGDGTTYLKLNGVFTPGSTSDGVSSAYDYASSLARVNAVNSVSNQTGVTAETLGTIETLYFSYTGSTFTGTLAATDFKINGTAITGTGIDTVSELIVAINASSTTTGVVASTDSNGNIKLEAKDGRNIQIQISDSSGNHFYDTVNISASSNANVLGASYSTYSTGINSTNIGAIRLYSSKDIVVETNQVKALGFAAGTYRLTAGTSLQSLALDTESNAQQAIKTLDATITQISSLRANISAIHSRLDNSASKLVQDIDVTDNAAQALGGADMAVETANLVYNQLLQNSSLASIIQANVSRVTVSKLLGEL